jgi:hypothetical protein
MPRRRRLNRLREKGECASNIPKNIPQGLKPSLYFMVFAARLKSCPDTKHGFDWFFPQPVRAVPFTDLSFSAAWKGPRLKASISIGCHSGA